MGEAPDAMSRSEERPFAADRAGTTGEAHDEPIERDAGEPVVARAADDGYDDESDADGTDDASATTEAIKIDIEQCRVQLSGTIDEIQERLSPTRLINEAKETVRDATVRKATSMMSNAGRSAEGLADRIREHPVSAALIGAGAWWLLNKLPASERGSSSYARRYGNFDTDRNGRYEAYEGSGGYGRYGSEGAGTNDQRDRWSQEAGESRGVRGMAQDATETISDYASRGQQRIGDIADRAESQFNQWMRENPLAVGVAAIAVGAAIGLAIPETDRERELIGATRDRLVDKAQEMASHTVEQVASAMPGGQEQGDSGSRTPVDGNGTDSTRGGNAEAGHTAL